MPRRSRPLPLRCRYETRASLFYGVRRVSDAPSIELLSSDVDVMNAVAFGSLAPVQEWLDGGGNVELRGHKHNFTLLHIACENRQLAMIELLLDRGAGEADLNPHPRPHP